MTKKLNTTNHQDESKEAITSDNSCVGCSAKKGQLHHWPCDDEECPFCGGQAISCDCFDNLMAWAIQSTESVDLKHFTESEKERWLELIGNLKYQWEEVVDSPFETIDMIEECPPYWCKTKALLKAFWKIQKKFIKLDETLDYKWEEFCAEKGRIPFTGYDLQGDSDIPWKWIDGVVNKNEDHIKITYSDARSDEKMIPIASISPGKGHIFNVQFIYKGEPDAAKTKKILKEVRRELDFYLVEKGEKYPWEYAKYHCTTAANLYSNVHWGWFPKGWKPKAR